MAATVVKNLVTRYSYEVHGADKVAKASDKVAAAGTRARKAAPRAARAGAAGAMMDDKGPRTSTGHLTADYYHGISPGLGLRRQSRLARVAAGRAAQSRPGAISKFLGLSTDPTGKARSQHGSGTGSIMGGVAGRAGRLTSAAGAMGMGAGIGTMARAGAWAIPIGVIAAAFSNSPAWKKAAEAASSIWSDAFGRIGDRLADSFGGRFIRNTLMGEFEGFVGGEERARIDSENEAVRRRRGIADVGAMRDTEEGALHLSEMIAQRKQEVDEIRARATLMSIGRDQLLMIRQAIAQARIGRADLEQAFYNARAERAARSLGVGPVSEGKAAAEQARNEWEREKAIESSPEWQAFQKEKAAYEDKNRPKPFKPTPTRAPEMGRIMHGGGDLAAMGTPASELGAIKKAMGVGTAARISSGSSRMDKILQDLVRVLKEQQATTVYDILQDIQRSGARS